MNNELIFRVMVGMLFLAALSVSLYYRITAERSGEKISRREEGWWIMVPLRLLGLCAWGMLVAFVINPQWVAWATAPLPDWLRWAGIATALVALPMVYWVFSSLGKNVTDTVVTRKEHALVTSGPYRWVRHPLYTIAGAFFMGLSIAAANWLMALGLLTALVLLAIRTPREEAKLVERFGDDYRAYMRRTGRFIPRLGLKTGSDSI
jgi:protein-S-isoprenylcysteine O-methyltransferase Ste14